LYVSCGYLALVEGDEDMPTGTFILTEVDDADEPASSSNVISLFASPPHDDPLSIGDLAAVIVSDLSVRLRGNFELPRLVARSFREEG
jgi:hypothetical protein